jgi:hypothetical protein
MTESSSFGCLQSSSQIQGIFKQRGFFHIPETESSKKLARSFK